MKTIEERLKAMVRRMAAEGGNPSHIFRGTDQGVEHIWIQADGSVAREIMGTDQVEEFFGPCEERSDEK